MQNDGIVCGAYLLSKPIYSDDIVSICLATHKTTNQIVEMRRFKLKNLSESQKNFLIEKKEIFRIINHINILQYYETFESHQYLNFSFEHSDAQTVENYLSSRGGRLNEKEAKFYFLQLVNGVVHLHQKEISHMNLNPRTVLINEKTKRLKIRLSMFSQRTVLENEIFGSRISFLAPEIINGSKYSPMLADIFSCGAMLAYFVLGEQSYEALLNGDTEKDISENILEVIKSLTCSNPSERLDLYNITITEWLNEVPLGDQTADTILDSKALSILKRDYGINPDIVIEDLLANLNNGVTIIYKLIKQSLRYSILDNDNEIKVLRNNSEEWDYGELEKPNEALKEEYSKLKKALEAESHVLIDKNEVDSSPKPKIEKNQIYLSDALKDLSFKIQERWVSLNLDKLRLEIDITNQSTQDILNQSFDQNHSENDCKICEILRGNIITKLDGVNFFSVCREADFELEPVLKNDETIFLIDDMDMRVETHVIDKILYDIQQQMPLEKVLYNNIQSFIEEQTTHNELLNVFNKRFDYYFKGQGINIKENYRYMHKITSIGELNGFNVNENLKTVIKNLEKKVFSPEKDTGKKLYTNIHRFNSLNTSNNISIRKKSASTLKDTLNDESLLKRKTISLVKSNISNSPMKSFMKTRDKFFFNNISSIVQKNSMLTTIEPKNQVSYLLSEREAKQLFSVDKSSLTLNKQAKSGNYKQNSLAETFWKDASSANPPKQVSNKDTEGEYNTSKKLKKYKREFNVSNLPQESLIRFHSLEKDISFSKLNSTIEIDHKLNSKLEFVQKITSLQADNEDRDKSLVLRTSISPGKNFHKGCCSISQSPIKKDNNTTRFNITLLNSTKTYLKQDAEVCGKILNSEGIKQYLGPVDPFCSFSGIPIEMLLKRLGYTLFHFKLDFVTRSLYEYSCNLNYEHLKFNITVTQLHEEGDNFYFKFKKLSGGKEIYYKTVLNIVSKVRNFE